MVLINLSKCSMDEILILQLVDKIYTDFEATVAISVWHIGIACREMFQAIFSRHSAELLDKTENLLLFTMTRCLRLSTDNPTYLHFLLVCAFLEELLCFYLPLRRCYRAVELNAACLYAIIKRKFHPSLTRDLEGLYAYCKEREGFRLDSSDGSLSYELSSEIVDLIEKCDDVPEDSFQFTQEEMGCGFFEFSHIVFDSSSSEGEPESGIEEKRLSYREFIKKTQLPYLQFPASARPPRSSPRFRTRVRTEHKLVTCKRPEVDEGDIDAPCVYYDRFRKSKNGFVCAFCQTRCFLFLLS
ncbi:hypothetical protein CEXT_611091 [Caerostris extrusa]|uniref:Uncharacterized protein n=1 Tax=Caerostris extrusa TaxID=172846 RepID=A0AAV4WFQ4_CAEEX|nr:hypothetical protein CEXT_611091 [Caerostris extrusa]